MVTSTMLPMIRHMFSAFLLSVRSTLFEEPIEHHRSQYEEQSSMSLADDESVALRLLLDRDAVGVPLRGAVLGLTWPMLAFFGSRREPLEQIAMAQQDIRTNKSATYKKFIPDPHNKVEMWFRALKDKRNQREVERKKRKAVAVAAASSASGAASSCSGGHKPRLVLPPVRPPLPPPPPPEVHPFPPLPPADLKLVTKSKQMPRSARNRPQQPAQAPPSHLLREGYPRRPPAVLPPVPPPPPLASVQPLRDPVPQALELAALAEAVPLPDVVVPPPASIEPETRPPMREPPWRRRKVAEKSEPVAAKSGRDDALRFAN